MGRYSRSLAPQLADLAGVRAGQRALDVGCGPGALTTELVGGLGAEAVAAADPSEPFVEAARQRHARVEVAVAGAEDLPFEDGAFDVSLAQLVVSFMSDPTAGVAEMGRVTRAGGGVAACVGGRRGLRVGSRGWQGPAVALLAGCGRARPGRARRVRAAGRARGTPRGA